jgi:pyruvyltransferase
MSALVQKRLLPAVKLYWWRLHSDRPGSGNFGDEITKEIVETVFHRRVEWASEERCQIIGAGSIIERVTENKGGNRPYLWGSGFIRQGTLTVSSADYKIIGVRGRASRNRIAKGSTASTLGDPGLLADRLLQKNPEKQYSLGILPHYVDLDDVFVQEFKDNPDVRIIDPTLPCAMVIEEIAKCDAILSSSLHGLIVADSLAVPNLHLKLSSGLIGGAYKFIDYYSIYSDARRQQVTPGKFPNPTHDSIKEFVLNHYKAVPGDEMKAIKDRLVHSFPL